MAGCRPFADYADLQFWVGRPPVAVLLAITCAILLFSVRRARWRVIFLISSVALLNVAVWTEIAAGPDPPVRVTFIDVGNGDAALLETPDRRRILLDAGYGNENYSAGRARVAPFLHSRGIDRLDVLCVTSGDAGAAGGAPYLLESIPVGELWAGRGWSGGKYYDPMPAVETAASDSGVPRYDPAPATVSFGEARVVTVESEGAVTIILDYGRFRLLYPGFRAAAAARDLVLSCTPLNSTVVKVPASGDAESHARDFPTAVEPALAVISTKRGGKVERPVPGVVAAYETSGAVVLVTADHGSIVVETDGWTARVRTAF